jgi:hypothetical protein
MVTWEDLRLTPKQVELLERSAITPEVAHQQGVRHIRNIRDLPPGFAKSTVISNAGEAAFPGILFRYHAPLTGSIVPQYRPDTALPKGDGSKKLVKYISQPGTPVCPHVARQVDAARLVLVVEGTKQCLAALANTDPDVSVVGVAGCYNWQLNGVPHPQWKMVAGLPVVIAMDADAATNPDVYRAATMLGAACKTFGAESVRYLRLKAEGKTDGLDDVLGKLDPDIRPLLFSELIAAAEDAPADVDPSLVANESLRVEPVIERGEFHAPPVVPAGVPAKPLSYLPPRVPTAMDLESSKSVVVIAGKIVARCDSDDVHLIVESSAGGIYEPVYAYQAGAYRVLPETWLHNAIRAYDGKVSASDVARFQRKTADEKRGGIADHEKWHASPRNIAAVNGLVRAQLMSRYGLAPGKSPLRHDKPITTVFTNGTICWDEDTQAMRWEAHSPWHRASWGFGFDYEPGLVPEHMLAVMRYSFANCDPVERDKRVQLLRAAAGVAFLGAYSKVRRALWLSGNGNDGKGVYTNLVRGILKAAGAPTTGVTPDALSNRVMGQSARKRLEGSRCNFGHEISSLENVSEFKSVLQCEEGDGRAIGFDAVSTQADCAHILDSNYPMPKTRVDNAWRRRIALVLFENPIPANYPVDRNIDEKLLATQSREFTCWAIDGALEVLANGGAYDLPRCHFEGMDRWGGYSGESNVSAFFQDAVEDSEPGCSKRKLPHLKALYGAIAPKGGFTSPRCYLAWHKANGFAPKKLAEYPAFVEQLRSGTVPGVTLESSCKVLVARVAITQRQAAMSEASVSAPRVVPEPLNVAEPFQRPAYVPEGPEAPSATEAYEARPYKARRGGNVIPLYEDDMTYDNEAPLGEEYESAADPESF